MPIVRHRLDLVLIPSDPDLELPHVGWAELYACWRTEGVVIGDRPGPAAHELIAGGFRRLWLDCPGGITLYANHQGGYRVCCPVEQSLITSAFVNAVRLWRSGGPRSIQCPACGAEHPLEALDYRPHAGFAKWAVVISDVESLEPNVTAFNALEDALGPLQTVLRRVG